MKPENAVFFHQLHESPPHIIAHMGQMRYKIMLSGKTYILLPGGHEFPAPGCPLSADRLIIAQLVVWLTHNRRWWPAIPVAFLSLFALQAALFSQSETTEMRLAFIALFSQCMNIALVILALLCIISIGLYNFGKGVRIKWGEETPALLGSGEITIAPDTFIVSESESDDPASFAARLESARMAQKPGEWIVSIPFRHPAGVIIFNPELDEETSQGVFRRDEPPYEGADWPEESRTSAFGVRFERESFAQYLEYLRRFAGHFPEWSKVAKLKHSDPAQAMANTMRRMANTAAIMLLFAISVFGQKNVQVRKYLGDYRYDNDRPRGEVKFVFQKAVLARIGKGDKTYRDLLPAASFYTNDDNAGSLIGIRVSGAAILPEAPETAKSEVPAGELQPIPTGGQPRKTFWESLPDSNRLEQMKADFIRQKIGFGRELAPRQSFVTWFYWQFIAPILFLIGIAAWYVAKSAYSDSAYSADGVALFGRPIAVWGHYARYIVFFVAVINVLVLIVDMAIADYFASTNMWWWLIKSVSVSILAWVVTQWIVPNPNVKRVQVGGGGNYPRINS